MCSMAASSVLITNSTDQSALGLWSQQARRRRSGPLINPQHYVVRTAWLFWESGRNFLMSMYGLAGRPQLKVASDQYGSPTYVPHLAAGISQLIETEAYGTYHLAGQGGASRWELVSELFRDLEPHHSGAAGVASGISRGGAASFLFGSHERPQPPRRAAAMAGGRQGVRAPLQASEDRERRSETFTAMKLSYRRNEHGWSIISSAAQ